MKISFITTVYNEEKTIDVFLDSLLEQTQLPDEIIIVDGGSRDNTINKIVQKAKQIQHKKIKFTLIEKEGNRSVGRNEAITHAKGEIIVCSDAGNRLDKQWLEYIVKPFVHRSTDVVAGYYNGVAHTVWQKALIPYVLVMPDKIDPDNFLPATRSMAFKKSIWQKMGGFPEEYAHNEDYVFARKLRDTHIKITFVKDAVVNWLPPRTIRQTFRMFWRFAYGDIEAGIVRPKVIFIFFRYLLALCLLGIALNSHVGWLYAVIVFFFIAYVFWAINKNYRYVHSVHALYLLPFLQFLSDAAVMSGSCSGFLQRKKK